MMVTEKDDIYIKDENIEESVQKEIFGCMVTAIIGVAAIAIIISLILS